MTDPKYGEPVEEPTTVDDVVGRAHEGLADAEAAGRDAVADGYPAEPASTNADAPRTADPLSPDYEPTEDDYAAAGYDPADPVAPVRDLSDAAPAATAGAAGDRSETFARDERAETYETDREVAAVSYDAPATTAYEPPAAAAYDAPAASPAAEVPAATAYDAPAATAYDTAAPDAYPAAPGPQPIFVQAPEAPRPRGNRGAAGAIGLLAAVAFGALYLAAWLGFAAIAGDITEENLVEVTLGALTTWALWMPVISFFLAFWLLGAIINRGRWGLWVIFGLLVGVAAYGGHLLGQLMDAPFWTLTASQGAALVESQLLVPLAATAFILGRELTIWFGAWVAARGRRVTELNAEAQREYERTLEAGPQLYRQ
ncbi:ABC transporter [Microbacterium sp. zg.Y1090]|uniref:ABC transporter n=1 Tax=Microbacterium TaxID=33882 RepID=UPI00214BDC5A|nr:MULTISPECIES: ABC transporter [unclassified Microbacterium]MCR2813751.1 ABC transporter [Microbacterium sp. zg.Y1084]MCR2819735.1 ABC transporter [Microbacterium sp. zg.Y1090]MDL5488045.1 ABC transporter [Microbacterium sp. zg-Y1211]WIM28025.1 ABC transporter [Microbacterium sp. zg-Y1090]